MTWAVVKMHSEASAMIVERRDEVFILKGWGCCCCCWGFGSLVEIVCSLVWFV